MEIHGRGHGKSTIGDPRHGGTADRASGSVEASLLAQVLVRPLQREKRPPCCDLCATGTDVRGWIGVVAQRHDLGLTDRQALVRAWNLVTAVNPFPATLGRICPHPCESGCVRGGKDGAVAIKALERFLGDWGLQQGLGLPGLDATRQPESIGVIGAGPAGLSFAYQMARRGFRVTVYEKEDRPGGMLYYGIPQFRLPEAVVDAEIRRILELGVELELGTAIGRDISVRQLRDRHAALFVGIGASRGLRLGIPGEDRAGVWTGTAFLAARNRGEPVPLGAAVVVIGGGNTAMDAARCARRTGARVTILYRRTSGEMPAIESEVREALAEGVNIECLVAPIAIEHRGGRVRAVVAQRMRVADPDASGRRRCVPVEGSGYELPADTVIAAVYREADWSELDELAPHRTAARPQRDCELADDVWAGGDALGPGIAGVAIAHGRRAAAAVHAQLRGLPRQPPPAPPPALSVDMIKADYYRAKERASPRCRPADARLMQPDAEVEETIGEETFLEEAARCFSCGLCFGCGHCFTYCNAGGYSRLECAQPGAYFSLSLDRCEGCAKCIDICPCGFLSPGSFVAEPGTGEKVSRVIS